MEKIVEMIASINGVINDAVGGLPGLILLMTALLVVMLVAFSLMSLANANADYSHARKIAQNTSQWYAAQNEANAIIRQLRAGETPNTQLLRENGLLTFTVPIREDQYLLITLQEDLTVTGWQTITTDTGRNEP